MRRSLPALIVAATLLFGAASLSYSWTDWEVPGAAYIAQVMLRGGAPYVDAWNIKAPGVYFAYALGLKLFGGKIFALRLLDLLWQGATALAVGAIAFRMFKQFSTALVAGVAYILLYFSQNYYNWAKADGLAALPLAIGFLCTLRAMEKDSAVDWACAGAGVGIAVVFKLALGLLGIPMLVAAFAAAPRRMTRIAFRSAMLAVGLCVPLAACALYLHAKGAWQEFLRTQFVLAPQYVKLLHDTIAFECVRDSLLRPVFLPVWMMAALGVVWLALAKFRTRSLPAGAGLVLSWLVISGVVLVWHGAYLAHHYYPLFAPIAVLGAPLVSEVFSAAANAPLGKRLAAVAALLVLLVIPAEKIRQHWIHAWHWARGAQPSDEWLDLARELRGKTSPNEPICVWGNMPVVYVVAERPAATRFVHTYFLLHSWRGLDYREIFLNDFRAHPPRFFVLAKEAGLSPCLGINTTSQDAFNAFTALKDLIASRYQRVREEQSYVLYEETPSGALRRSSQ